MAKFDSEYEGHLELRELLLAPGAEWMPRPLGWSIVRLIQGNGYYLHPRLNQEMATGGILVLPGQAGGMFRASQVSGSLLSYFRVEPERLIGLLSAREQDFLCSEAAREHLAIRSFSEGSSIAEKLKCLTGARGFTAKLQLLQVFSQALGGMLGLGQAKPSQKMDARQRLEALLGQITASELLDVSFVELAEKMRCTPRHLSRVFHELTGMSFREKQTELRLTRARELLATTEAKVLDVALDTGYQSQSLFNGLFKRRFGLSPAKWRRYNQSKTSSEPARVLTRLKCAAQPQR